jgi:site-specific DNA recombinase
MCSSRISCTVKPEAEWVFSPVEPIVSEALWKECNDAMDARKANRPLGPKPVHLFAGLLYCGCGQRMYVFSRSPKYVCPKCRNKITVEDIDGVSFALAWPLGTGSLSTL